jgi:uncharacterized protein (DUF1499 family)
MYLNGCTRRPLPEAMNDADDIPRAVGKTALTGFRDAVQLLILSGQRVHRARSASRARPGGPGIIAGRVETRRRQPFP